MEGVTLTPQVKEDLRGKLKLTLEQNSLILPRDNPQLLVQMTTQQCESKSGTLKFSHQLEPTTVNPGALHWPATYRYNKLDQQTTPK